MLPRRESCALVEIDQVLSSFYPLAKFQLGPNNRLAKVHRHVLRKVYIPDRHRRARL